jgi:hypothetical protein
VNVEEFLRRLPPTATEEARLIETAFGIPATFRQKAAEIRADAKLSEVGKTEQIKQAALGGFVEHLKQIRSRAAAMTADVNNLRSGIKPKAPDHADVFGEMQRAEVRTWLRSLPPAERIRAALEDESVAAAVLHVPPALSGLTSEVHERVVAAHVEKAFGSQLRGIQQREEVLEVVNSAIQVATTMFQREGGLTEKEIEQ